MNQPALYNKASDTVSEIIERNLELEEIMNTLQPLLFELSSILYADGTPIRLDKLVLDSINYLKANKGVTIS